MCAWRGSILVTAVVGTAGVVVWGYISQRYIADFMPFFIVASAVGMIEVWRLLEGRSRRARGWALGGLCALAAYGVAANVAVAAWPVPQCIADPDGRVRGGPAVAEPRFARCQRSDGRVAPLLGSLGPAVRGQPLLGPLPVERRRQFVGAGPTDRALHLDAGRAEPRLHPRDRVHVQPPGPAF